MTARHGKQIRYEMFLDGVQKKEDKAILASIPRVQTQMVDAIEKLKAAFLNQTFKDAEKRRVNWEKSIVKLRENYKQTMIAQRTNNASMAMKAIEEFTHTCSSWCNRLDFRFEVKKQTRNDSRTWDHRGVRIERVDIVVEPKTPFIPST